MGALWDDDGEGQPRREHFAFASDDDDGPEAKTYYLFKDPVWWLDDATAPKYHVEEVLPLSGLTLLYGATKSLKSFVAVDLATAVMAGQQWHGHATAKGLVIYIAAEDSAGLRLRFRAAIRDRGLEGPPYTFRPMERGVRLDDPGAVNRLLKDIETLKQLHESKSPALIVIDTLSACMAGDFDENSTRDMGKVVSACRTLTSQGSVLLIHHCGKDAMKGPRGAQTLSDNADAVIKVTKTKTGCDLTFTKRKNAPPDKKISLRSESVVVPLTDGTTATTLVMRLGEGALTIEAPPKPSVSRSRRQDRFLELVRSRGQTGMAPEEVATALACSVATVFRDRKKLGDLITTTAEGRYVLTHLLAKAA